MNAKIYFQAIFFLIIISKSFGQINLELDEIYLNSQTTIEDCNTVDFGTVSNNNLVFYYTLSKPLNQGVSSGTIKVKLKYNSSSSGDEKTQHTVQSSSWNDAELFSNTISTNIEANEIQVSGSSILLEFIESGITYKSCEYPLTKTPTPTFELANDSYSIPCGSTSNYTFTVNNVYNSPGTLSYSWNVGTGWKRNGFAVSGTITTSTNSITLVPNSTTVLPSNVSVTTTLDGQTYGTETATVNRSNIAQTITAISGPSTLCSGTTAYNFGQESVVSGQSVSWSISDTSIATLSNATNTGVSLTQVGSGEVTLTATISNGCGQSYSRTKTMFAGGPPSFNVARGTAQSEFCDTKYHYVPFTISNKSPFLNYSVNVFGTNGSLAYYTTDGFVLKFSKNYNGWATFTCSASNSCGTQSVLREAYIDNCNSIPYGNSSFKTSNAEPISIFKVYPNPASDVVYLDLADNNNSPAKNVKIEATLYDMLGFEKQAVKIKDHKATIDVSHLPKGLYILMVTINDQTETHLISVE